MNCPNCGHHLEVTDKTCPSCGKVLLVPDQANSHAQFGGEERAKEKGRGSLILSMGILGLFLAGPILGIPAWVMGRRDLKKIRDGVIDKSQRTKTNAGMVLGIISTIVGGIIYVGIAIAVTFALVTAQDVVANRDAIMADITTIAVDAHQYRNRPAAMEGGDGSYIGYVLPLFLARNGNATYMVTVSSDEIAVRGSSANGYGEVFARFGQDGKQQGSYEFTGQFQ